MSSHELTQLQYNVLILIVVVDDDDDDDDDDDADDFLCARTNIRVRVLGT